MKAAILLHGSGVYDGTEIQEAVLCMLALNEYNIDYECFAPNIPQFHVINHLNGEVSQEIRNVLTESARIARGHVFDVNEMNVKNFDCLIMPGGFGTAKNLTTWAINGSNTRLEESVLQFIVSFINEKKPIGALCMSPTTLAIALRSLSKEAILTVGSNIEASHYDIASISIEMESIGMKPVMKTIKEISIDKVHKIVCAPCYMMDGSILDVYLNIKNMVSEINQLIQ